MPPLPPSEFPFPPEIAAMFVEELGRDRYSLIACACACRLLRPTSQRELFRSIYIGNLSTFNKVVATLTAHRHLARHVEELQLAAHSDSDDDTLMKSVYWWTSHEATVKSLAAMLKNMSSLTLEDIDCDGPSSDAYAILLRTFRNVKSLSFYHVSFIQFRYLGYILQHFTKLTHLEMVDCTIHDNPSRDPNKIITSAAYPASSIVIVGSALGPVAWWLKKCSHALAIDMKNLEMVDYQDDMEEIIDLCGLAGTFLKSLSISLPLTYKNQIEDWQLDEFTLVKNTQLEMLRVVFRSEASDPRHMVWLTELACSVPPAWLKCLVLDVRDVKENHLADIDLERVNSVFSKPAFSRLRKIEIVAHNYQGTKKEIIKDRLSTRLGTLASRRLLLFTFPRFWL